MFPFYQAHRAAVRLLLVIAIGISVIVALLAMSHRSQSRLDGVAIFLPKFCVGIGSCRGSLTFVASAIDFGGSRHFTGEWLSQFVDPSGKPQVITELHDSLIHHFRVLGFEAGTGKLDTGTLSPGMVMITVPDWMVDVSLAALIVTYSYRCRLRRERQNEHRCFNCGYDLRASNGTCPECGRSTSGARKKQSHPRISWPPSTRTIGVVISVLLFGVFVYRSHHADAISLSLDSTVQVAASTTRLYDLRPWIRREAGWDCFGVVSQDAIGDEFQQAVGQLIEDSVDSDNWKANGGKLGSIRSVGGLLIVTNSSRNQRMIRQLLNQLSELPSDEGANILNSQVIETMSTTQPL